MVTVNKLGIVLSKTQLNFECIGVLNPAVYKEGNIIFMYYRAIGRNNISTIGYCELSSPVNVRVRYSEPLLYIQANVENQGLEDPRIVKIDDCYYLTFT